MGRGSSVGKALDMHCPMGSNWYRHGTKETNGYMYCPIETNEYIKGQETNGWMHCLMGTIL